VRHSAAALGPGTECSCTSCSLTVPLAPCHVTCSCAHEHELEQPAVCSMAACVAVCCAGLLPFAIGSETWGSIVCPATTVGVSAYRPTGGTIPNNGLLQVIKIATSIDL